MDADRFDTATRSLTTACSRRGALVTVLGGTLGPLGLAETAAKKGKGKKKKKHRGNSPPPPPLPPTPPLRTSLTQTFSNNGAIPIPGIGTSGIANPYPSTIVVSGFTNGTITDVNVHLNGFTHGYSDDVDILLAAPHISGVNAIVMSDVGFFIGGASNVSLVLDDAAATPLPGSGPLASGTFQPTNNGVPDAFSGPAPTPTGNSLLSAFNGQNPNGPWQLWVVDDNAGGTGTLAGGWALQIKAEVDAPAGTQDSAAAMNRKNTARRPRRGKGRR